VVTGLCLPASSGASASLKCIGELRRLALSKEQRLMHSGSCSAGKLSGKCMTKHSHPLTA
jgi:hypothetical protein